MEKDKRKSIRRPLRYTAWVALEDGTLHGCVLSDVSDTGARIDIDETKPVPDDFVLLLASNGSAKRTCKVVWRQPRQIGVMFDRRPVDAERSTLVPTPEQLMARLAAESAAPVEAAAPATAAAPAQSAETVILDGEAAKNQA